MRFALIFSVLALILTWRGIAPLRVSKRVKLTLFALLWVLPIYYAVTDTVYTLGSAEWPRPVIVAANFLSLTEWILTIAVLAREVLIFVSVLAGRRAQGFKDVIQRDKRVILGMTAVSASLSALGLRNALRVPDVVDHTIAVKNLPPELEGFTFIQLSDIHCSKLLDAPFAKAVVERVNATDPDLILITGDLIDGTVKRRTEDVLPLQRLQAKYGVWACEGNHEHYLDYDRWMTHFKTLGIRFLQNEHTVLSIAGQNGRVVPLVLGGVRDPVALKFGRPGPDVAMTFKDAPDSTNAFRILMAHQPRFFKDYRDKAQFDLMLSGHTHGGQVRGMDQAVAIINRYVDGQYQLPDGTKLYVHPGTGLWGGFAVRLGIPSEIARITLVRENNASEATKQTG